MLGDEIRKARIERGLSQEALAFQAQLSRNYISLLELNRKSPTVQVLFRMCEVMGIKASVLLARVEKDSSRPSK